MRIFIDSAILEEIQEGYKSGLVDGVTTNPSLIKKAVENLQSQGKKIDMKTYIQNILSVAKGTPVSLEVTETTYEGMVTQGKKLYKLFNPIASNVVIKIPVNPAVKPEANTDGIKAIRTLASEGIPVNCTLIFTPEQALLAAKAGAMYVSPFAGRIDDYIREHSGIHFEKNDYFPASGVKLSHGEENMGDMQDEKIAEDNGIVSGIDLVRQCVEIFRQHNITKCKVLSASLRNARQVRESALVGAHVATLPWNVVKELLVHYKTAEGMISFIKDVQPEYAALTK